MHDARIFVYTIPNEPDSIDLIVITKDFLSLTAELNDATTTRFKTKIGDVNIMGTAQKVQFTALLEKKRDPDFDFAILYRKNSIASTFINASVGYTKINPNLNDYKRNEHTWQVNIERPLVSQYLHVAGALMVGHNQTYNNYTQPDSVFYQYRYSTFNAWIGYNLGVRKFLFIKSVKNRQFISLLYFRNKFTQVPYQVNDKFNFRFKDRAGILAQFTFLGKTFIKPIMSLVLV